MVIVCIISLIRTKMIGGIDERLYHVGILIFGTRLCVAFQGYSYFTVTSTCLINSMLIYVIIVTHINDVFFEFSFWISVGTTLEFGPYRWLFITFAVINICIALIHPLLIPVLNTSFELLQEHFLRPFLWPNLTTFALQIDSSLSRPCMDTDSVWTFRGVWRDNAKFPVLLWVFLFYQTYVLLAFHYVYRFILLCRWKIGTKCSSYKIMPSSVVIVDTPETVAQLDRTCSYRRCRFHRLPNHENGYLKMLFQVQS